MFKLAQGIGVDSVMSAIKVTCQKLEHLRSAYFSSFSLWRLKDFANFTAVKVFSTISSRGQFFSNIILGKLLTTRNILESPWINICAYFRAIRWLLFI